MPQQLGAVSTYRQNHHALVAMGSQLRTATAAKQDGNKADAGGVPGLGERFSVKLNAFEAFEVESGPAAKTRAGRSQDKALLLALQGIRVLGVRERHLGSFR